MIDFLLITAIVVLAGSLLVSIIGVARGWRMRRFHDAQRAERRSARRGSDIANPRGRR